MNGNEIHEDILPFIGKPSEIKGIGEKMDEWYLIKINIDDISIITETSNIY